MGGAFGQGKSSTCKQTAVAGMIISVSVIVFSIYHFLFNDASRDRTRYILRRVAVIIIFPIPLPGELNNIFHEVVENLQVRIERPVTDTLTNNIYWKENTLSHT